MVHNDLHASNVFLDDLQPEDMSTMHPSVIFFSFSTCTSGRLTNLQWPRIVVADFGRMFYELNVDPNAAFEERDNPRGYRIPGDDYRYPMVRYPGSRRSDCSQYVGDTP